DARTRRIDRAAALLAIEETADGAEMLVGMMAQDALAGLGALLGEALARRLFVHAEMLAEAANVVVRHDDARVGAAVAGTLGTVVELSFRHVGRTPGPWVKAKCCVSLHGRTPFRNRRMAADEP